MYKIVQEYDDEYFSFNSYPGEKHIDIGICREYRLGEWTRPKEGNGPLCVFGLLEDAEQFMDVYGESNCYIFECEIVPSDEKTVWVNSENFAKWDVRVDFPATHYASAVKLTKLVV